MKITASQVLQFANLARVAGPPIVRALRSPGARRFYRGAWHFIKDVAGIPR